MLRLLTLAITLSLGTCSGGVAYAQKKADRIAVELRAAELMKWIVQKTDYKPVPLPAIIFVPHEEMVQTWEKMGGGGHGTIQAIYYPRMMVLRDDFQLGVNDDVLLHELVHHLQFRRGRMAYSENSCFAPFEVEAYALQATFVEETGIGERPDMFMVLATQHCGGN